MLRLALQNIDGMANQTLAAAGRPDTARSQLEVGRRPYRAGTVIVRRLAPGTRDRRQNLRARSGVRGAGGGGTIAQFSIVEGERI